MNYNILTNTLLMKQLTKNIFLYFSAFVPMYFLIQVKFLVDLISGIVTANAFTVCVLIFLLALIILGVVGLLWNIRWNNDRAETVIIKTCKNITDQHFLGYLSIFILFALSFDLTKPSMFCIFLFILIFVGIVYVNNKLFYINPFLNILGFNFYEITYDKQGEPETDNESDKESENEPKTAKLFYRGDLQTSPHPARVKLKNDHFSFVDRA